MIFYNNDVKVLVSYYGDVTAMLKSCYKPLCNHVFIPL